MLILELQFRYKRDCLPNATFSMASELQDLRGGSIAQPGPEYNLPPKIKC